MFFSNLSSNYPALVSHQVIHLFVKSLIASFMIATDLLTPTLNQVQENESSTKLLGGEFLDQYCTRY
jgi:hypothetical protein